MIREIEDIEIRDEFSIRARRILRQLGMLILFVAGAGILLFSLPSTNDELPDCYEELAKLTGLEIEVETCEWVIREHGENKFTIFLNVNNEAVAEIEIDYFDVIGIPDFELSPYKEGWGTYIEVKRRYWNQGLGQLLWRAGDQHIRKQFEHEQVRIYINASSNNPGFANAIRRQVKPVFISADGDFIYIID